MSNMHTSLRADKHLRHGGRMQYGLFLKVKNLHTIFLFDGIEWCFFDAPILSIPLLD